MKAIPFSNKYPTSIFLKCIDISERKKDEFELKEHEKQLTNAQLIGKIGSWQFNFNTGLISISEESYRIYGLEKGKTYTIKEIQKIPLSEYRSMLDERLDKLRNGNDKYDVEFKILRPNDGQIRDIHSIAEYDADDNIVTGVIQDITEQKQAKEKVSELSTMIEQSADSIIKTDTEFRITYMNPAAEKLFGWSLEEIKGLTPDIFNAEPFPFDIQEHIYRNVSDGKVCNLTALNKRKDKSIFYCQLKISPIQNENGEIVGYMASQRDITDLKKTENELLKSKELFKSISTSTLDAIILTDSHDKITYWNPAAEKMFGYSSDEIIGKKLHPLIAPENYIEDFKEALCRFQQTGQGNLIGQKIELFAKRKNGDEFPIELSLSSLYSEDQWFGVGVIRDITERKKTEKALIKSKILAENANRAKSEFLANVSHELRTPLNSVIGFSHILIDKRYGNLNEIQKRYASNINKSGKHLLKLINDILAISKIESGTIVHKSEYVNISNIIDETVANLKMKAKQKDINITYSPEIKNSKTYADRSQIKQIMYNLLSNAIKFTPEQGEIKVNSQFIDSKIQISVEDTGVGIPEEKYNSIFDPFKQVDSSTTREYEGTGLGLALVKKYVEMHGGDIWFESEVGKGSTFTFNIPSQLPFMKVDNKHP